MSRYFWLLLLLWLGLYAAGFYVWGAIEPTGDGFTRGMNRALPFFGVQLLALLAGSGALILAIRRRPYTPWWGYALGLLPFLGLIGLLVWRLAVAPAS